MAGGRVSTPTSKRCPQCGETKPASAFGRRSGRRRNQLQSYCRACMASYRKNGQWSAVHVPASLHDTIRRQAQANGLGVGELLSRAVRQTLDAQCHRPGCLRPRGLRPLCERCDAEAVVRADTRVRP